MPAPAAPTTLRQDAEREHAGDLPGPGGEDARPLFAGLAIEQEGDEVWAHSQRHPVLSLTFKDVKATSWDGTYVRLRRLVRELAERAQALIDPDALSPTEREELARLVSGKAPVELVHSSLRLLSRWLHAATGERVVILVDEYDSPIHSGVEHGYYDEVVGFMRTLLSGALRDNPSLFKGVLKGILRVAKESLFSGLNNLAVYTTRMPEFRQSFGFTPEEVQALAHACGAAHRLDVLAQWYDGYDFGGQRIYNPWSVLSFLRRHDEPAEPYWVNTASDALLRRLLAEGSGLPASDVATLLSGGSVLRRVDDNVPVRELESRPDALWGLLVHSGYLTARATGEPDAAGRPQCALSVPNQEVARLLPTLYDTWMQRELGGETAVRALTEAILGGDAEALALHLEPLLVRTLAHLDFGGPRSERVYQASIVGLLVHLQRSHRVHSNPDSGFGRADVLVIPRAPGEPGAVLELKVAQRGQAVDAALGAALAQIRDRDYAERLREAGAHPIHTLALVFDGKRAHARAAPPQ